MNGDEPSVSLVWIPLGAGQRVVRFSGRCYERLVAWAQRRAPVALYHAALEVTTPAGSYVIELAPVPDPRGEARGVVRGGVVGSRWFGRLRWFRYELRCWPGGTLPDRHLAVGGPLVLTTDPVAVTRLLEVLPLTPTPTWGRDEQRLGEMWNSNSVIAWLLVTSELMVPEARPPLGGRAPGWDAGIRLAEVQQVGEERPPR